MLDKLGLEETILDRGRLAISKTEGCSASSRKSESTYWSITVQDPQFCGIFYFIYSKLGKQLCKVNCRQTWQHIHVIPELGKKQVKTRSVSAILRGEGHWRAGSTVSRGPKFGS